METDPAIISCLSFLAGGDAEHAARRQMRLQRGSVHVLGQLVGAMDLARDGAVLVAAHFVAAVNEQFASVHFHLKRDK
jgi:hypothetical protein